MKLKIKKNKHYPFPYFFIALPIWVKKEKTTIRTFHFMFTESCLFDLKDEDQYDVNKLFGFSIGHHQKDSSFRIGWRPDLNKKEIEIVAYEYHNGIRQKTMSMGNVKINHFYNGFIAYLPFADKTYYKFGNLEIENKHNLKKKFGLGYTLGLYFGGNEKAPQDIIIHKIK